FVFRRYLDYGAIASLRDLHAQVRAEVARRELHDDIKLGPGGIREIEFVAQVFQLVRGGQDPTLRLRPTLATLEWLNRLRRLPAEATSELRAAYVFLRNLEHRLQYLDDEQTQRLPTGADEQTMVAHAMACAVYGSLLAELERHRRAVTRQFEAVFADQRVPDADALSRVWLEDMTEPEAAEILGQRGYREPSTALVRLRQLRDSQLYRRMAPSTRTRVDRLAPR